MADQTVDDKLHVLHSDIEFRAHQIMDSQRDWPCRRGCDYCCRHLAALPQASEVEWRRLSEALIVLPEHAVQHIKTRLTDLITQPDVKPITCPFLDKDNGSCMVYEARPTACRTYGFYAARDGGLYCPDVANRVEQGDYAQVIWGNAESLDVRIKELGDQVELLTWIRETELLEKLQP
jgi:uncharacterized protein